jgi:hypothetical protein
VRLGCECATVLSVVTGMGKGPSVKGRVRAGRLGRQWLRSARRKSGVVGEPYNPNGGTGTPGTVEPEKT